MTATEAPSPPVMRDPDSGPYATDEDDQPLEQCVGWDLSWNCRVSVSQEAAGLDVTVAIGGEDQRRGIVSRTATAAQVRDYAHKLLALLGGQTPREPRVWLPGDTVLAEAWAVDEDGFLGQCREYTTRVPLVEVLVPDFAAAVAAEQARRAAGDGEKP